MRRSSSVLLVSALLATTALAWAQPPKVQVAAGATPSTKRTLKITPRAKATLTREGALGALKAFNAATARYAKSRSAVKLFETSPGLTGAAKTAYVRAMGGFVAANQPVQMASHYAIEGGEVISFAVNTQCKATTEIELTVKGIGTPPGTNVQPKVTFAMADGTAVEANAPRLSSGAIATVRAVLGYTFTRNSNTGACNEGSLFADVIFTGTKPMALYALTVSRTAATIESTPIAKDDGLGFGFDTGSSGGPPLPCGGVECPDGSCVPATILCSVY